MMRKQKVLWAVAAIAAAMVARADALNDKVSIDYEGDGAEFVRQLSGRLEMPFLNLIPERDSYIAVRQGADKTVASALRRANREMQDENIKVGIFNGFSGKRMILMYDLEHPPAESYFHDFLGVPYALPESAPAPALISVKNQYQPKYQQRQDYYLPEKPVYEAAQEATMPDEQYVGYTVQEPVSASSKPQETVRVVYQAIVPVMKPVPAEKKDVLVNYEPIPVKHGNPNRLAEMNKEGLLVTYLEVPQR